jgi:hypothetical protein
VFTACLTTPIRVALRWFCSRSLLRHEGLTKEVLERIPGRQTDRKTPLGELNWIFTAITDTIAWNCLPRALFQKLFRQVGGTARVHGREVLPGFMGGRYCQGSWEGGTARVHGREVLPGFMSHLG